MDVLPLELWPHIFQYFTFYELMRARGVCKQWNITVHPDNDPIIKLFGKDAYSQNMKLLSDLKFLTEYKHYVVYGGSFDVHLTLRTCKDCFATVQIQKYVSPLPDHASR